MELNEIEQIQAMVNRAIDMQKVGFDEKGNLVAPDVRAQVDEGLLLAPYFESKLKQLIAEIHESNFINKNA